MRGLVLTPAGDVVSVLTASSFLLPGHGRRYLTQQIHPPLSRLCGPIEGTDPAQIAECLGLNPAKYAPLSERRGLRYEPVLNLFF
jgi:hypothetical protein